MKIDNHNNGLPTWLDDFTSLFKKEATVKTAAVDVKSLPSVSWKGETYYVQLTPEGAMLYNEFGNEIRLLDHVMSIDGVSAALNDGSVEASAQTKQQERIAALQDNTNIDADDTDDAIMLDDDEEFREIFAEVESDEDNESNKSDESDESENDSTNDKSNIMPGPQEGTVKYGFNEIRADINHLRRQIEALSAQQYARFDTNVDVDNGAAKAEVQHFNETAENAQKIIDAEHAVDISTQTGRAKLNYKFLDDLFGDEPEVKQEIINNIESQLNGAPVDVIITTEENIPENVDEPDIEIIEEDDDNNDMSSDKDFNITDEDMPEVISIETIPIEDQEETVEEPVESEKSEEPVILDDENLAVDDSDEISKTDENEITDKEQISQIADEHICPFCGSELEIKDYKDGDEFCEIDCTSCDKKYNVNAENGKIFIMDSDGENDEE